MTTINAPMRSAAPAARGGWLAQVWLLVRWNLFTARRRLMGKVLLAILLAGFALMVTAQTLTYLAMPETPPVTEYCSSGPDTTTSGSTPPPSACPTQPEVTQQQQQQWQTLREGVRASVVFPTSLSQGGGLLGFLGVILLCILTGAVIGGEYAYGTLRLALSRGIGRAQMIAAQVATLAILALGTSALTLLLSALVGVTIGPALGAHLSTIPGGGWLEFGEYWLALALQLLAFSLVAFCIATLGRSTAGGIAASLGYFVLEAIIGGILVAVSHSIPGDIGTFLGHVPEWFLGNNVATVVAQASHTPVDFGSSGSVIVQIDAGRALAVSLAYCILLSGLGYLVLRRRDVTD